MIIWEKCEKEAKNKGSDLEKFPCQRNSIKGLKQSRANKKIDQHVPIKPKKLSQSNFKAQPRKDQVQ